MAGILSVPSPETEPDLHVKDRRLAREHDRYGRRAVLEHGAAAAAAAIVLADSQGRRTGGYSPNAADIRAYIPGDLGNAKGIMALEVNDEGRVHRDVVPLQ